MGTHAFVNARYQHEFGHTGPCTRWEAHFPPRWGTAAAFRRHLRPADIRKTCGRRGPRAPAFVVWASGRPSRGGRARARAREHEMAAGAGAGRPPPRAGARRSARPRVPPDARRDTKGWSESTERGRAYGAARGPERPGPDYRGRSWARRNRPLERGLGCGAARLPRPSPSVNGRNGLAGRAGAGRAHRGAGAALAAAAGRPGASILPRAP